MNAILWITSVTLAISAAQSYILLTANLEDVQSIARQIADSPIADQIKNIWRRASNQFNQQLTRSKMHQRAEGVKDDKNDSAEEKPARNEEDDKDSGSETDNAMEDQVRRRSDGNAVGKEVGKAEGEPEGQPEGKADGRTERKADDLVATGKNSSYYHSSVKNTMDNI